MSKILISLALAMVTVAVYLPVRHHEFVNYDDPVYVNENPNIRAGLNWQSVALGVDGRVDPMKIPTLIIGDP